MSELIRQASDKQPKWLRWSGNVPLMANAIVVTLLGAISIYIKFAGLFDTTQHHARVELLSRLFEERFLPSLPYIGLLANVSEILWCVAAVTCWLTYALLRRLDGAIRMEAYLLYSAILLSVFLVDDIFRLTLILALWAGIPKTVMFGLYGSAAATYGIYFRQELARTPYALLLGSTGLLIISALAEVAQLPGKGTPILLEDGAKLLGILNICLYFYKVCCRTLIQLLYYRSSQLPLI